MARVLQAGHHVHFSDVDVVYLREVWPSYRHIFANAGERVGECVCVCVGGGARGNKGALW